MAKKRIINISKFILVFLLYLMLNMYVPLLFIKDLNSNNQLLINTALITSSLIIMVIFMFIYHNTIVKDAYKINKKVLKEGAFNWVTGLVLMLLINVVLSFIGGTLVDNEAQNREIIRDYFPYAVFSMCIYAPIVEELIFRRGLRPIFKNKYFYILTSGLIFALAHLINEIVAYLNTGVFTTSLLYVFPYMALGSYFALSYYDTKNIYSSVIFHSIHNIMAIIFNLLIYGGY